MAIVERVLSARQATAQVAAELIAIAKATRSVGPANALRLALVLKSASRLKLATFATQASALRSTTE
jgi:hypothetical protein